MSDTVKPV